MLFRPVIVRQSHGLAAILCIACACGGSNSPSASPNSAPIPPQNAAADPANDELDEMHDTNQISEAEPAEVLTADNFETIVQDNMSEVLECYAEASSTTPGIAGKLIAEFIIDGHGKATRITASSGSTLDDAGLLACLEARAANWSFPPTASGDAMTLTFPFQLEPA